MTSQNTETAIALLQNRKARLEHKPFDWNAWKKGTLLVLNSLFGEESTYFRELSAIDYQYSSWSLRDTSGSGDPVKASCAELLDICMDEAVAVTWKNRYLKNWKEMQDEDSGSM